MQSQILILDRSVFWIKVNKFNIMINIRMFLVLINRETMLLFVILTLFQFKVSDKIKIDS